MEGKRRMAMRGPFLFLGFLTAALLASLVYGQQLGDSIVPHKSLRNGQTLVSAGDLFEMGFFSPPNSELLYLGIWFIDNGTDRTIIWVANRDSPLKTSTGFLNLTADGILAILDGSGQVSWSTNTSNVSNPTVKLLDSGNLVLTGGSSQDRLWQSFDYPYNTMVSDMKIGIDFADNYSWYLTSWRSSIDPSPGDYTYKLDPSGVPEFFLYHNSSPVYRSGPWIGDAFSGRPEMASVHNSVFSFIFNQSESFYTFHNVNPTTPATLVLNESGVLQRYIYDYSNPGWKLLVAPFNVPCDNYAACGSNAVCIINSTVCQCLLGFKPKNSFNWNMRDFIDGCVLKTALDCQHDGFLKLIQVKLPATANATIYNRTSDECHDNCLENCSCTAYAPTDWGCITWTGDLLDLRKFSEGGDYIYYRVPSTELPQNVYVSSKKKNAAAIGGAISVVIFGLLVCVALLLFYKKHIGRKKDLIYVDDLPIYDLATIKAATNNFSSENKLGHGCFGVVYKGWLKDGQEIAAKKLSKFSFQGTDEFMNEVQLISKLQHRNLIRLLGCCIEGDERILIYEHLENKSLDTFIFDVKRSPTLCWQKRLSIINGITRGLLYLHQDSRLNIIHRDLKPSNILLDREMNPKISDFGTAKMFEGDQEEQDTTTRVVGTIGYMSPEYAMGGIFSVKSDVFSFGVIVLEIISGKRNNILLDQDELLLNLIGNAWRLWRENRALELLDKSVEGSCPVTEILRCIQIALACVQEKSDDRPTMDEVCLMLGNGSGRGSTLSYDLKPPVLTKTISFRDGNAGTTNQLTITIEGR